MSEIKIKENIVLENVKNFVASDELQFNFYCPGSYVVTDKETLGDAEKNQKIARAELKRILELTGEKKKFLDDVKKVILDYEKTVTSKSESAVKFFENPIQDYKRRELERQQLINRLCNEINQYKSAVIQNLTNLHNQSTQGIELLQNKCNALIQKYEIENSKEEIDQEIIESIEQIQEAEIVPVEIVAQEKNFVQTNAIQKKESYSIRDEQAYIEYAKENKLWHLLDIKPAKAGFNLWVKESGNKNKPFVLITESLK